MIGKVFRLDFPLRIGTYLQFTETVGASTLLASASSAARLSSSFPSRLLKKQMTTALLFAARRAEGLSLFGFLGMS